MKSVAQVRRGASAASSVSSSSTPSSTSSQTMPKMPHITETELSPSISSGGAASVPERFIIADWPAAKMDTAAQSTSAGLDSLHAEVQAQISACLQGEPASSTMTTYQACLLRFVPAAEAALHIELLPMDSDTKLFQLFGFVKHVQGDTLNWATCRTLRAAVKKWHHRRDLTCPFDEWTHQAAAFCAG